MVHAAITSMICCPHTQPAWGPHFVAWSQFKLVTTTIDDTCSCATFCGMNLDQLPLNWSVHWLQKAQIGCKRPKPLDYYIRPLPPASTKDNPLKGCLSTWLRAVNGWPQLEGSNRIFRTLIDSLSILFLASHVTLLFYGPGHWTLFRLCMSLRRTAVVVYLLSEMRVSLAQFFFVHSCRDTHGEAQSWMWKVGMVRRGARVSRSWPSCSHAVTSTYELSMRHIPASCL